MIPFLTIIAGLLVGMKHIGTYQEPQEVLAPGMVAWCPKGETHTITVKGGVSIKGCEHIDVNDYLAKTRLKIKTQDEAYAEYVRQNPKDLDEGR